MNNGFFLVCPFHKPLVDRLGGRSLVFRIDRTEDIHNIVSYQKVGRYHSHCIWLQSKNPLGEIKFQESWRGVPLALAVPALGRFRDVACQLPVLRQLNIRIYLPTDTRKNMSALRILASLGINSCVVFHEEGLNWELMTDLMTYALLGTARHAHIEPFHYLAANYAPNWRNDFGAVYFNDPTRYLHLDEQGRVSLSPEDCASGRFIVDNIENASDIVSHPEYIRRTDEWRNVFLEAEGCAYCQGWRICLGKFSRLRERVPGCREFFVELIETLEQHQSLTDRRRQAVWQP